MKGNLRVYSIEQCTEWDEIVKSFKNYDVYWLSGYVKAFQIHGDGEPVLFFYEDLNCRGINAVMKRDISKDKHFVGVVESNIWFDFVTPYGYGGWIIEGEENADLFSAYEEWCLDHNIISEFVRYHPVIKNYKDGAMFYDTVSLGGTIAMDISSTEAIWSNLKSKNRNMVRKAKRAGVEIYNGRYPQIYEEFRNIYNGTMDKDDAEPYYYFGTEFYQSLLNDLSTEAQVFYAELNHKVIATSIILGVNHRLNYHLSGSLREYQNLAPTNLLLYQAALWGCANGYTTFHLGGGVGCREDSLYKFKKAFYRGESCCFYIGKKLYAEHKYNELVNMRSDIRDDGFFPLYRG
ncbi:MAG: peptidoglycan bridge formation glycyltransferase FemA/FemB family protein [Lachnospiraceae bacterium]|nr:peptidoglycan bridge formation glycyltransferase FemA/FemB family protein [Lachnospiraceae bacterium]